MPSRRGRLKSRIVRWHEVGGARSTPFPLVGSWQDRGRIARSCRIGGCRAVAAGGSACRAPPHRWEGASGGAGRWSRPVTPTRASATARAAWTMKKKTASWAPLDNRRVRAAPLLGGRGSPRPALGEVRVVVQTLTARAQVGTGDSQCHARPQSPHLHSWTGVIRVP